MSVQDIDLGMEQLIHDLDSMGVPLVSVGVRGDTDSDLVTIAAANEFGTRDGHVPERSFLRSTADAHQAKYLDMLRDAVDDVLDGRSPDRSLRRLGSVAVGDVQRTIRDIKQPPNAPSTIRKKGSDNPLIDTGRLRQSIEYAIGEDA